MHTGTYLPGAAPTSAYSSGKSNITQTLLEQNVSYHSWVGWLSIHDRVDIIQKLPDLVIYSTFGSSLKYQRLLLVVLVISLKHGSSTSKDLNYHPTRRISHLKNNSKKYLLKFHIQYIKKQVNPTLTKSTFAGHTLSLLKPFKNTYKMNHHTSQEEASTVHCNQNLTSFKRYIISERVQKETSLRIVLMYCLGWLQRNPLPLGLLFTITPLQLSRHQHRNTTRVGWKRRHIFTTPIQLILSSLRWQLMEGKRSLDEIQETRRENGHRSHNTLFTFVCNHL